MKILDALRSRRFDLENELLTHNQIADALKNAGISFEREKRLGESDRPDFLCEGGVVIEVKLKGSAKDVHRQIMRYCRHPEVNSVILATARTMGLPRVILGKRCYVHSFGKEWL